MPSTHFIKQIQEDSDLKEGDVSHVLEVGLTKSPGFSPRLVSHKVTSCVACLQEQQEVSESGQVRSSSLSAALFFCQCYCARSYLLIESTSYLPRANLLLTNSIFKTSTYPLVLLRKWMTPKRHFHLRLAILKYQKLNKRTMRFSAAIVWKES